MRILITGICGFVGSTLAESWLASEPELTILGMDNFIRPGSEQNRHGLKSLGVRLFHGDIRSPADIENLPGVDWVIDAAANPGVLAGVDGRTSSRQLVEHNLSGTVNLLEYCRRTGAGLILLSTSRTYSISQLTRVVVETRGEALWPVVDQVFPEGLSNAGVSEKFSTAPPLSLYGSSKLASETLALEYGNAFGFPVWINRCGNLAGAGQFGRADQGICSFWINSWLRRKPLTYFGFGGSGHQVRDFLHPRDLVTLLKAQVAERGTDTDSRTFNLGGGLDNAISLAELSNWCREHLGEHHVSGDPEKRRFDIPWIVMDSALARSKWNWQPRTTLITILTEIASHAEKNPHWLELSESE